MPTLGAEGAGLIRSCVLCTAGGRIAGYFYGDYATLDHSSHFLHTQSSLKDPRNMALSFPRSSFTDDFFSPFFGPVGFPDITRELNRALAPLEGTQPGQLALTTRGMPVDVVRGG